MADDPDDLYRKHENVIEAVIRAVCRELGFQTDTEDFGQEVRLRLIDPERKVWSQFTGRGTIEGYLYVAVKSWGRDWQRKHWGPRWRPTKGARDFGPAGTLLGMLMVRDGLPFDQALAIVLQEFPDEDPAALGALAQRFRLPTRPRPVVINPDDPIESQELDPEQQLIEADEEFRRERVKARVAELVKALPLEDRLPFLLRFDQGEKISNIARTLKVDQKALYRRLDDIVKRFRKILKDEGLL